ncbi:MAG: AmmeMemoRadiSam system protein B [candidate division WOR-3 bacterium]
MNIRKPAVSGAFYPSEKKELENLIGMLFENVEDIDLKIKSAITPHAGYIYSGETASYVYKNLKNYYERIVILGVSHHYSFNYASLDENERWQTPLGEVEIDLDFEKRLKNYDVFKFNSIYHSNEHSLEVQVPFLQYKFKDKFKLVPILIGTFKRETLDIIAEVLKKEIDDKTLVIASSDFYHGYSYRDCKNVNIHSKEILERGDPQEFFNGIMEEKIMACGASAIYVLLKIFRNGKFGRKVLYMTTSQDVIKEKSWGYVVGYISFVIYE